MAPITRQKYDFMSKGTPATATPTISTPPTGSTAPVSTVATRKAPVLTGGIEPPKGAYNPYTKGFETIAPTVGVNEGQFSPANKQALWNKSGQTGDFNMDAFQRGTDNSLQIKDEFKKVDPSQITSTNDANSYLQSYEKDRRAGVDYGKLVTDLKDTAPQTFSRADEYTKQREAQGIGTIEGQINDLSNQEAELMAQKQARIQGEQGKAVPMGVIEGRVGEVERQENERIGAIGRQRQYLTDQLKVKNDAISTMMTFKGQDYDTATKAYDAEFSKNMQLVNLVNTMNQTEQTAQDRVADNARATLTTVYNSVTSGGLDPRTLSPMQKLDLQKLEMQAGMPPGIIQNLYDKNPKSDIVFSTKSTEADGNDYVQMVVKDKITGATKVEKFLLGKSAEFQQKQEAAKLKAQTEARMAAKKTGGSGGGKSTSDKSAEALKKEKEKLNIDVDTAIEKSKFKVMEGDFTRDEAHASVYSNFAPKLKKMGLSDDQIKEYINNGINN